MKKKILVFIGIFAVVTVGFLTSVNALSLNGISRTENNNYDSEFLDRNAYLTKVAEKVDKVLSNYYNEKLPSYFGGMYINDESTKFIIQIVKDNLPLEGSPDFSIYKEITSIDEKVEIEYVKNSYTELTDLNNSIIKYFTSKNVEYKNLNANYIDVMNNTVVVELLENNQRQASSFQNAVINSNAIVFLEGKNNKNYATINAGQSITVSGGGYCSMGFRARLNGKNGYITAGHCVTGLGATIPSGVARKYQESGKIDATFIETNSTYNMSDSLMYPSGSITKLNNTLCPYLAINTVVAKSGATTKYTSGQVKSKTVSGYWDGFYFTNLIGTNMSSAGGDSGSPVFTTSLVDGGAPLAGILKGSSGSYSTVFVEETNIWPVFQYTRY